jgi:hypothetical protein
MGPMREPPMMRASHPLDNRRAEPNLSGEVLVSALGSLRTAHRRKLRAIRRAVSPTVIVPA